MKRLPTLIVLLVLLVLGFWVLIQTRSTRSQGSASNPPGQTELVSTNALITTVTSPAPPKSGAATPLIGETILLDYGSTNLPPENDLTLISRLMDNFILLVKSARDRPLSANEDWAAMLRGVNPSHERFLPDLHPALNAQGRLVDRWGTPLFFHALGGQRFEIRSAGPDKKLWTDDDIHRNADGSFRHGGKLNPPSLSDRERIDG